MPRLPDFLIVGAPRSGSTTLYRLIDEHPEIFMARPKEIGFFSGWHDEGVAWYAAHFADAQEGQKAGEATPWYLHDPSAVTEMKRVVPDAHLIVILRDPVERTYSHYWMERIRGRANGTFEEYIDASDVLGIGCYVDHLENLAEHFARDHILVVFLDDLKRDPAALYATVCRFLGVDSAYVPLALGKTVNWYVEFRSMRVRAMAKRMPAPLAPVRKVIDRLNTRTKVSYPPMSEDARERLASFYAVPNARLARWLGTDIPDWTRPSRRV